VRALHHLSSTERFAVQARLLSNIKKSGSCWEWQLRLDKDGYGDVKIKRRVYKAHRASYELFCSFIPRQLVTDHLCRNRCCINPKHIEPVTNRENMFRGNNQVVRQAAQTHCINGHLLTAGNIYSYPKKPRMCKTCVFDRTRRRRTACR
jgi:hypothetical protein